MNTCFRQCNIIHTKLHSARQHHNILRKDLYKVGHRVSCQSELPLVAEKKTKGRLSHPVSRYSYKRANEGMETHREIGREIRLCGWTPRTSHHRKDPPCTSVLHSTTARLTHTAVSSNRSLQPRWLVWWGPSPPGKTTRGRYFSNLMSFPLFCPSCRLKTVSHWVFI